jgi:uncharacterized phage protein (TIGR01671 family)
VATDGGRAMMREIKFRAWHKKSKLFLISDRLINKNTVPVLSHRKTFSLDQKHVVFQQFTGLKDKNNREIYEGDIVLARNLWGGSPSVYERVKPQFVEVKYLVEWSSAQWHLQGLNEKSAGVFTERYGDWYRHYPILDQPDIYGIDVIGNIYENPELLEVQP